MYQSPCKAARQTGCCYKCIQGDNIYRYVAVKSGVVFEKRQQKGVHNTARHIAYKEIAGYNYKGFFTFDIV